MANRTVKFIGYTAGACTAVFTFNGNEVFNGAIAELGTAETPVELFNFEIDRTVNGNIPGILAVTGSDLTVVSLSMNHSLQVHDAYTKDDGSADAGVTEEEAAADFQWASSGSNQSKINITIDGAAFDKGDVAAQEEASGESYGGAWHVEVGDGKTMACDWVVTKTPTAPTLEEQLDHGYITQAEYDAGGKGLA